MSVKDFYLFDILVYPYILQQFNNVKNMSKIRDNQNAIAIRNSC